MAQQHGGGRRQERHTDKTAAARGETTEKVVFINRCAKVVKGGRRFSFSALIVAGDHDGKVGCGFGKANEVAEAIRNSNIIVSPGLIEENHQLELTLISGQARRPDELNNISLLADTN